MPERRANYAQDHDLVIRIDENLKNLIAEFKSLKDNDIREIKEGTKADITKLQTDKADKIDVAELKIQVDNIKMTVAKYVAYATVGMLVFQIIVAILIKKYI